MRNDTVVKKMMVYIEKILKYTQDMDYTSFIKEEMVVEACVFNLSQLGELANKVDEEYQMRHKAVPWRQIYGLRNRIVHDYEGVNLRLVWEIIHNDLPVLQQSLGALLK